MTVEWYNCRHCGERIRVAHRWITLVGRATCDGAPTQAVDGKELLGYHELSDADAQKIEQEHAELRARLLRQLEDLENL